ncbi:MAG: putative 2-aminoethylphosphonate ABC transporter permease subunit [Pseudomonadales bacterium]
MTGVSVNSPRTGISHRSADDWLVLALLTGFGAFFLFTVILPVWTIFWRSLHDRAGLFVGFTNYYDYFGNPALLRSIWNSLVVAFSTTIIVISLAFTYAYALTRSCMRGRSFFKAMAMVPLLTPGLLKAIALVYFFGNQGIFKEILMGYPLYGPVGIVMASTLWTLPHAIMIISASLLLSDARLYEAARSLKAGPIRTFLTVTLPNVRYGLMATGIFVFVRVLTDFGIPKVIGGNYSVLATDIYKEVVGQQNFEMGAVVSIVLLIPALLAFMLDRYVSKRQSSSFGARSVVATPTASAWFDRCMWIYCATIATVMLAVIAMGQFAALVKFWPYNLELTLDHYRFDMEGVGLENFKNSLILSFWVATIGTAATFVSAYLVEKPRTFQGARQFIQALALLPMAIPGLVLGLGFLLVVNKPGSFFDGLYGTIALLVIATLTHYYTVTHLTSLTALKQLDKEFESVAISLKVPLTKFFFRITVPMCAPSLVEIWGYLFLNSMTSVSTVIFLYGIHSRLASLAVVHMDEAGRLASAAAMAMLIVYACIVVRIFQMLISKFLLRRLQSWRLSSNP